MSAKKFAFIICSNDDIYLQECLFYVNTLFMPEGYEVEIFSIIEAVSMTKGYNEGMSSSDAKYKIYLHQDVFIINRYFLLDILAVFETDPKIGMIGMVGPAKMPWDGVMWHDYRMGALYGSTQMEVDNEVYRYRVEDGIDTVAAVDGLLMATSVDILWREDLFDGWDFYDVSQSFEMRRRGYKIVVPVQKNPWCLHDDGFLSMLNYNKYRLRCLKEYPEFIGK